jgi:hypothetical protein
MARIRSVDFLPEIFQTPVNKQFLAATLDQLVQEPKFEKTQGFVGRRVGPGVNPRDRYVIEPTKNRNDYQLEPGVVSLKTDTDQIADVITYPGINDALKLQGADISDAQRLYTSEYYSWDPFVDFDKLVNFSQYYWLPFGPDDVDVSATDIPLTDNFVVTRANGVYTFSGVQGTNPALTLLRGGNYTFQVAQNDKETVNYLVTNNGTSAFEIDNLPNPTLTLVRGNTYVFNLQTNGVYPFYIKTEPTLGTTNTYDNGVSRNGAIDGLITFVVPQDAPDTLYYLSSIQLNMRGQINVIDAESGTGPGFWIQATPGVSGRLITTPNISSRDVLGVVNNGEDLGTIQFNVPLATAQNFFYDLTAISSVGLVSTLPIAQVNNQPVADFIATYGGIDGILDLDGRTVIFPNETTTIYQIRYTLVAGIPTIQLVNPLLVNTFEKFSILFGAVYSSTQWYKNAEGNLEQIPLLTANLDSLWYQDGTDPEIFGRIRLIDQTQNATIDIDDILGAEQYTSPNGVVFTNGLKVTFRGTVVPAEYENNTYYVEGVGTAIKLLPVTNFVTPETYTQSFSTPYDSTPYDVGGYDATLNAPVVPEYLTINRASPDLNAWTRANRWFHIDVITATAEYNNTTANPLAVARARRPILEFRAGTKLFNFGTQGKQPVDVIDFTVTDAFSNINGTTGINTSSDLILGYSYRILELGDTDWNAVAGTNNVIYSVGEVIKVVSQQSGTGIGQFVIDGYALQPGSLVIFAADTDPEVRNKIYQVEYITPDTVPPLIVQPIINLIPAPDSTVLINQTVVCLTGTTLQGISFWFDGVDWIRAQQKSATTQAPLFDIYDLDGVSFSNIAKYPSTTFVGTKLFSYAIGTGVADTVLGFPLRYLTLANVGDIVFDNNLYKDTFIYVEDSVGKTVPISNGLVHQYSDRVIFVKEIGWQTAVTPSLVRQQFQFTYDGSPLRLDVSTAENNLVPAIQLYVGTQFQDPSNYTVTTTANSTTITLNTVYSPGAVIEVNVLSDQVSRQGFYQVPINLENNPLNQNSETLTLGTIRSHYETIGENLLNIQGPIIGANNTRDLGNLVPYGLQILQQSSPLTLTGYFLRNQEYDIFGSLDYNSREYIKFKSQLLETVIRNEYNNMTVSQILDAAVAEITQGRTDINPFYWSDMLPSGSVYTDLVTTVTPITTSTFSTTQTYDFRSANYLGLLVYVNDLLLIRDTDYVVATDGPRLTITRPLAVGEVVTIREYSHTYGNFVPNTPSKMGLYPKYRPEIFVDTSYVNPTAVIQGHDGSITAIFGDIRDQVLLEFEKRIYNNIKVDDNPIPLTYEDVAPGFFRTTDYTQTEITDILSQSFLSWVGWNKIDYKTQNYIANNAFTWNYSSAGNKLTEQPLLGAWRGIYRYFYDTESPATRPWEMLGFSEEPDWWSDRYGPAPYTSDNLVLWDDLEAGLVADPIAPYVLPEYARPRLTEVIPTGTEGQLLAPIESVVGYYDPTAFQKSWVVGDGGPAESAWWTSSSYPFAVMRLLALTRPAQFFSLFADRDLYRYNDDLGQYVYNGRYRLDANGIEVYGNGVSKASYVNWIVDYNQQLGRNSTDRLTADLQNLDVRLCYRMASFTDKQYLKIFTERSSPDSLNSSLLLPDESYNLLLYKNQPFSEIIYSALIVERTQNGYAVYGYSTTNNYFEILASSSNGILTTVSAGGATVRVPTQYTDQVVQIPYGYVFTNTTVVVDFILSYGAYLASQGLIFDDVENGYTLNWNQMAQEFLYFAQQGWAVGTMINLNPAATKLKAFREGAIVDTIVSVTPENLLLDQNRTVLPTRDLVVERLDNNFSVSSVTGQTISYLQLRFTNVEDMVVLDNVSVFNDLIYDPVTAARQSRVRITASTTTEWNGQLDAQGFILNQNNVEEWKSNRKYTKGEIVLYKGTYWSAQTIVQPKLEFNYNDWVKSDYSIAQEGLLPNIANKADQLANSYNINTANLERDNDLLSYGLIGFRPRQYMQALNLDDVSQVNIYQQFLRNKGTVRSAEIFTRADLGKESAEYNIFENWGILVSTYGANANRSFLELRLNEALLPSDPATIQVIEPEQASEANQTILLQDVWRTSRPLNSTNILPVTYNTESDTALPSAGYVNVNDADISVFSLDDPSAISQNIENVGIGTIIWVAKSNSYDWNIYRCELVPGQLRQVFNNLNGTSVAQFNTAHNLSVGDLIVIRYFDDAVNGVYRVLSVPSINSVVVAFNFENTNQNTLSGNGLVFYLQSARVRQASDVASLPYVNLLTAGAKAWVDNNGQGHWQVLEKQIPFVNNIEQVNQPVSANEFYGTSVTQTINNLAALVGAPGANSGAGALVSYYRGLDNAYTLNVGITLDTTGTVGLGNAVEFGNQTWAVAGASASNNGAGYALVLYQIPNSIDYIRTQLLVAPDLDFGPIRFGTSVDISQDERWMYIGAPVGNKVYAYNRVDQDIQTVSYSTSDTVTEYNYSDSILISPAAVNPGQLVVTLDSIILQLGTDYTVNSDNVVLSASPSSGQELTITRRARVQLDQQILINVSYNYVGTGSGAEFTLNAVRGSYAVTVVNPGTGYLVGDTVTIPGTVLSGGASPANDLTFTITQVNATTGAIETLSSVSIATPLPLTNNFSLAPYLYTAVNLYSFTVLVNGQLYRPEIDYDFNSDSSIIDPDLLVFTTIPPVGAEIIVAAETYWQYMATIVAPGGTPANARFGQSVSTTTDGRQVMIGAPNDDADPSDAAGSTLVYDRSVVRYIVNDNNEDTYAIPGTVTEPVTVLLNGEFLSSDVSVVNGSYSIVGSDIVLSSTTMSTLTIGDIIEIETNQFQLLQKITANAPFDQADFGAAVDVCPTNCSIYIGAPLDGTILTQAGSVDRRVNQSRVYGVTTSLVANPSLTAGDTIRINNVEIAVPNSPNNTVAGLADAISPKSYSAIKQYYPGDRVLYNAQIYVCILSSLGQTPTNATYWTLSFPIPNVTASATSDLTFTGNGIDKVFDIGDLYESAASYTSVVYVNGVLQTSGVNYNYVSLNKQIVFVTAPPIDSEILVVSGRLTVLVKNTESATTFNKLTVLPGVITTSPSSVFDALEFDTYAWTQTITSPNPGVYAQFGAAVNISDTALNLVIGAPRGNVIDPVIFDDGETYFDDRSTTFSNPIAESGVVYTFDYLPSSRDVVTDPGKFAFGQQIFASDEVNNDGFGTTVSYVGEQLLVGSPNRLVAGRAQAGRINIFTNENNVPAWATIYEQRPVVDVDLLNSVFMYDRLTSGTQTYFDFIDPLQGKILGAAQRNIDYIGAVDPADYNVGTIRNVGNSWAQEHVGEIWWDTDTVRFIDPNQDDITYASRRWGQLFPGSRVDIYQWVSSSVTPTNYTGPGIPLSLTSYTVSSSLNQQNIFETRYYFWVRGIATINTGAGKTLSTTGIARYIESPRSSGIPYLVALNSSTVAIYNALSYLSAADTILHIEYDRELTDATVHQEYQLIADGRPDSFLNDILYRKLQDSFCGADTRGAVVPDPFLSPPERYGVQFRPRQSMFVDRFGALQNYLERANKVLKQYPISESRRFNLLNSSEPEPTSIVGLGTVSISIASPAVVSLNQEDLNLIQLPVNTPVVFTTSNTLPTGIEAGTTYYIKSFLSIESFTISESIGGPAIATSGTQAGTQSIAQIVWDKRVATLEELSYQNINEVPIGYLYLVESDTDQQGKWTLYQVTVAGAVRELSLSRVQNYDTSKYWSYIDWYQPGYNSSIQPVAEVENVTGLDTLNLLAAPIGSSVRVRANAQGKFEIYLRTDLGWDRVGLEDGTIEFSAVLWNYQLGGFGFDVEPFDTQLYGFDAEPTTETRKIIQAINEELFIDDLAIERNQSLMLMFNYIYSELAAPEWLIKTSLVDVDHKIRALLPYQTYLQDNQDFVLDYIQEVKPYHVQVREFNLTYFGDDAYFGDLTDFDVPAYFDTSLLIPQYVSPVLTPYTLSNSAVESTVSDAPPDAEIWTRWPWSQWFNNYLLSIQDVTIIDGGIGYTVPPEVVVTGESQVPAEMTAIINSAGQVVGVNVINPGSGYLTTAIIEFVGGNGAGARGVAVMGGQGLGDNYSTNVIPTTPIAYGLSRSIKTTIKFDRYQYRTTIVDWEPNVPYENGTLVRYRNIVWEASSGDSSVVVGPVFDTADWTRVDAGTLSGVDRTMGFYVPSINMPGLNLPLLIDGIDYPGVQVYGLPYSPGGGYDESPYDLFPFDMGGGLELDAIYESYYPRPPEFPDPVPTGTAETDINVVGGAYIDTFSSHAPEELIPGSEFDTLDLRVFARSGSDWNTDGHGFPESIFKFVYNPLSPPVEYGNILNNPVQVLVCNQTTGRDLYVGIDYTVNWVDQTVAITGGASEGDIIVLSIYGFGGGNQLFKDMYVGTEITNDIVIPVDYDQIQELAIFVNGAPITDFDYEPEWANPGVSVVYNPVGSSGTTLVVTSTLDIVIGSVVNGVGFTSNQTVLAKINSTTLTISAPPDSEPSGTLVFRANTGRTLVILDSDLTSTDRATLLALGPTTVNESTVNYSWCAPVQQLITGQSGTLIYDLTNNTGYTNPVNAIVTVDGARARTAAGIGYTGDGTTAIYTTPTRLGFSADTIANTEVLVYFDAVPQALNVNYSLLLWTPGEDYRRVELLTVPPAGTKIYIAVTTNTQAQIINGQLIFNPAGGLVPIDGDQISVITWNDTSQQDIETRVFVGPVQTNVIVQDPFDPLPRNDLLNGQPGSYDYAVFNDTQWSFDYSDGIPQFVNNLDLGRPITNPDRLWVTLNGLQLWYGEDYIISGSELILHSGVLNALDVVMVTEFTENVVPEAMAFRIFQDMRELQATYRITASTTTELVQPLLSTDDIIFVEDASKLSDPNNTVDIGFEGDGSTETFTWTQNSVSLVEIYINDVLQSPTTYTLNEFKTSVTFDSAPAPGDNIVIKLTVFGKFGVVTIEGERIMYRVRNVATNTVSSLIRGTAGTASGDIMEAVPAPLTHPAGSPVYDMGLGNLLPEADQNYIVSNLNNNTQVYPILGNGINTTFVAEFVDASADDSTFDDESIEVYVGGTRMLSGYTVIGLDPVTVEFDEPPFVGTQVTILIRRGVWWYDVSTLEQRQLSLQETNTVAARFLRGEI